MLHRIDSLPLSQTLLCLYKFIIKSSICYSRYQWWIHALMTLSSFGSSCYILSPNPLWNSGSLVPLLFWALINKTLMLDHFPAVFVTAPLDSSMANYVLQSGRHQFLRKVLSFFQFMFYYNYIELLSWVQVLYKIWKTLIWSLFWALTNKCTFIFWQTSIIDEIMDDLISF